MSAQVVHRLLIMYDMFPVRFIIQASYLISCTGVDSYIVLKSGCQHAAGPLFFGKAFSQAVAVQVYVVSCCRR